MELALEFEQCGALPIEGILCLRTITNASHCARLLEDSYAVEVGSDDSQGINAHRIASAFTLTANKDHGEAIRRNPKVPAKPEYLPNRQRWLSSTVHDCFDCIGSDEPNVESSRRGMAQLELMGPDSTGASNAGSARSLQEPQLERAVVQGDERGRCRPHRAVRMKRVDRHRNRVMSTDGIRQGYRGYVCRVQVTVRGQSETTSLEEGQHGCGHDPDWTCACSHSLANYPVPVSLARDDQPRSRQSTPQERAGAVPAPWTDQVPVTTSIRQRPTNPAPRAPCWSGPRSNTAFR
jgi:hypothetical protein